MARLRNGDLEALNRHIDKHQRDMPRSGKFPDGVYPEKGRVAQDEKGRRVTYDVVNGKPQIRHYEGD